MTDHDAILRRVLENPACDTARGALADWHDDAGQADRAEFIRVQCRLAIIGRLTPKHGLSGGWSRPFMYSPPAHLDESIGHQKRERELWRTAQPRLTDFVACLDGSSDAVSRSGPADTPLAVVRRGLVAEVRLTLAGRAGGPCRRCHGRGVTSAEWVAGQGGRPDVPCPGCSQAGETRGTGRTEGVARSLFERHPVTAVRLVDREPDLLGSNGDGYCWSTYRGLRQFADTATLPPSLYRHLVGGYEEGESGHFWRIYPTADVAHAALSAAAVAWGRGLVGLPPLHAAG